MYLSGLNRDRDDLKELGCLVVTWESIPRLKPPRALGAWKGETTSGGCSTIWTLRYIPRCALYIPFLRELSEEPHMLILIRTLRCDVNLRLLVHIEYLPPCYIWCCSATSNCSIMQYCLR
jgi:hypothetical protein